MRQETVTRLRGIPVIDPFSKLPTELDWSNPGRHDMNTRAPAQPVPSAEPTEEARNSVTSGYRLFLDDDEDVTAQDRVEVRGVEHDVDGLPELRPGFALVVTVKRVEG